MAVDGGGTKWNVFGGEDGEMEVGDGWEGGM